MDVMLNKQSIKFLVAASVLGSASFVCAEETTNSAYDLSGYVTLTSDYRFRSLSNSDNKPTIQGGLRVDHESGLYAALLGSYVDLGIGTHIEADYILGYVLPLTAQSSLDLSYAYFDYLDADDDSATDYGEFGLNYQQQNNLLNDDQILLGFKYSPQFSGKTGKEFYYSLAYQLPIYKQWALTSHVGYTRLEDADKVATVYGGDGTQKGFMDYKIALSRQFAGIDTELAWVDNNLNNDSDTAKGTAVLSLTKSF